MNILFLCRHNRFRSKVAEALFVKYNESKENHVKSAGIMLDPLNLYVSPTVISVLNKIGAKVINEKATYVDDYLLNWADRIILVADNIDKKIFNGRNVFQWKITDTSQHDSEGIMKRAKMIDKKIKELIKEIS